MAGIETGRIGYDEALEKAVPEYLPLYQRLEDVLGEVGVRLRILIKGKMFVEFVQDPFGW